MSATLDPKLFQDDFKSVLKQSSIMSTREYNVPVVKCTVSRFEVELFYLDDLKRILYLSDKEVKCAMKY